VSLQSRRSAIFTARFGPNYFPENTRMHISNLLVLSASLSPGLVASVKVHIQRQRALHTDGQSQR
jgi:hypothetical protein